MKWLISLVLALVMVTPAFAGQDPYVAVVGNDKEINSFYISPKYQQFAYDQTWFGVPICWGTIPTAYNVPYHPTYGAGCEQFRSNSPVIQAEVCDTEGKVLGVGQFSDRGNPNAVVRHGNEGWYEWYVRLPKKPSGQINLVIQCGILKPNTFADLEYDAVTLCAAETGERIDTGFCTRQEVPAGVNPLIAGALPTIEAWAIPGPYAPVPFAPFRLTAFRNPSNYVFAGPMVNNATLQILDGSAFTRILLKSCMDKTVVAKLPVTGQPNAAGQIEFDLEEGDLIYVRMEVPRLNSVDVYCHEQSLRVMGVGEAPF
jgi:hypothetical protein